MSKDIEAIRTVVLAYQDAMNASSTDKVMALYAPDGVVMPQHSQARIGAEAVREAYDDTFSAIAFQVRFNIEEIVPTNADWAFARTTSAGRTKTKAGGGGPEAYQELMVFQKIGGEWKIARLCFCTTNPAG